MHRHVPRLLHALVFTWSLACWAGSPAGGEPTAPGLPWQPDAATAVSLARARHQHMVVLLAPPGSEAGVTLLETALAEDVVAGGLADMVWVKVAGDVDVEAQVPAPVRPAIAFVNPFTGSVLHSIAGPHAADRLAREVVHARRAIALPLTPGLEPVARAMFTFDEAAAQAHLDAGDATGLAALVAPAADDPSRLSNFLIATVRLPQGMAADDVRFLAGTDCLVGAHDQPSLAGQPLVTGRPPDLADSCAEYPLPPSGVVLVPVARDAGPTVSVRITAPGARLIEDEISFTPPAPGTAVQVRQYEIERLAPATTRRLSGRVLCADDRPAADSIVRIDGAFSPATDREPLALPLIARTDADGRFTFPAIAPGKWLVRAERAGGERETFVTVAESGETRCELTLEAVTTVGLRWALQTQEFSQRLDGPGVRTGEAFVSVASSRLVLAWGMRVRTADYADLMLSETPLADDTLPADTRRGLEALPPGTPVWYLGDVAYGQDWSPLSGLHKDARAFDAIDSVRPGAPVPAQDWAILGAILPQALQTTQDQKSFFQLVRGEPVRKGDVFVLRCVMHNCFAKLEVTDVTVVPQAPGRSPP
jgi:hypothetical protein